MLLICLFVSLPPHLQHVIVNRLVRMVYHVMVMANVHVTVISMVKRVANAKKDCKCNLIFCSKFKFSIYILIV